MKELQKETTFKNRYEPALVGIAQDIENTHNVKNTSILKKAIQSKHDQFVKAAPYTYENSAGKTTTINLRMGHRLVDKIIPFATDAGGNLFCFDYRMSSQEPVIVFWDHEIAYEDKESSISYVCDSFTELINKLYEG
ncbi:SMI1/KNR4 family protein [Bacillus atrophaeus]|uniref:SMI1/KNR4 family protein n=1 Tax=Bacillus atrophaeus TaxID=1452 RepID=UPI0030CA1C53